MEEIKNDSTIITFDREQKHIFGRDLTDKNNDPAFYNQSKRGIERAWRLLIQASELNPSITMYSAMTILNGNNIKTRMYCMMD